MSPSQGLYSLAFRNSRTEINLLVFQTNCTSFLDSEMESNEIFPSEERKTEVYDVEGLSAPKMAKDRF